MQSRVIDGITEMDWIKLQIYLIHIKDALPLMKHTLKLSGLYVKKRDLKIVLFTSCQLMMKVLLLPAHDGGRDRRRDPADEPQPRSRRRKKIRVADRRLEIHLLHHSSQYIGTKIYFKQFNKL